MAAAVQALEGDGVDLIITVHLAYSPSLEAIAALVRSQTPLLLLDTTMDAAFGPETAPDRIMFNHGIHGVQDLASVLRRRGRPFRVVAGHYQNSDVLARAADCVRAAAAARQLRGMKVLRVGESFRGMGDFFVEEKVLRQQLGIEVIAVDTEPLATAAEGVGADEIDAEMQLDRERYAVEAPQDVHQRSVQAGLGLRRLLEENDCGAFSVNFLAFDSPDGPLSTVPFLEASKAMAEGFGYAGEGDVLTAALVGALNTCFTTNFTEMFCPDWEGNAIFLSHMGEFNPACADGPVRLIEKDFPFTGAQNPAILTGAMKQGPAVLVNLAPGPDDTFSLLVAPVEVLGDATHPGMQDAIRGWIRPEGALADFLEWYSRNGGTHHCALVHGATKEALLAFAQYAGISACENR